MEFNSNSSSFASPPPLPHVCPLKSLLNITSRKRGASLFRKRATPQFQPGGGCLLYSDRNHIPFALLIGAAPVTLSWKWLSLTSSSIPLIIHACAWPSGLRTCLKEVPPSSHPFKDTVFGLLVVFVNVCIGWRCRFSAINISTPSKHLSGCAPKQEEHSTHWSRPLAFLEQVSMTVDVSE